MWLKLFGMSGTRAELLDQAVQDFLVMIEHSHWMHGRAGLALWGLADADATRTEVYQRDILVNKAERAVRKAIISHLSVNPRTDTTFCLLLMSVVKDAERIGDYCKNMMDLIEYQATPIESESLGAELRRLQGQVDGLFPDVVKAFRESNEALGGELVRREREITKACERLIDQVLDAPGRSTRQVVTYTLLARFQKRIAAHLGNIASSLVMPLHKLDYFDEQYLPGQEPEPQEDG